MNRAGIEVTKVTIHSQPVNVAILLMSMRGTVDRPTQAGQIQEAGATDREPLWLPARDASRLCRGWSVGCASANGARNPARAGPHPSKRDLAKVVDEYRTR